MHLAILPKNGQIYNERIRIVISVIDILGVLGAVVVMRAIPVERGGNTYNSIKQISY